MHELRNGNADRDPDRYADSDIVEDGCTEHRTKPDAHGYSRRYGHGLMMTPTDGETLAGILVFVYRRGRNGDRRQQGRWSWPKSLLVIRILPIAAC